MFTRKRTRERQYLITKIIIAGVFSNLSSNFSASYRAIFALSFFPTQKTISLISDPLALKPCYMLRVNSP